METILVINQGELETKKKTKYFCVFLLKSGEKLSLDGNSPYYAQTPKEANDFIFKELDKGILETHIIQTHELEIWE